MAIRSIVSRVLLTRRLMESTQRTAMTTRYFSEGKGKILSEEELAKETVYIKKMEKERLEKQKRKMEKEKAAAAAAADADAADVGKKKAEEEAHKG